MRPPVAFGKLILAARLLTVAAATRNQALAAQHTGKGMVPTRQNYDSSHIHRINNRIESTDRLVTKYNIRLLQTDRSERVPSGLLVAEYGEHQMLGEKETGLSQVSALIGDGED